jgi:hypothetical protein
MSDNFPALSEHGGYTTVRRDDPALVALLAAVCHTEEQLAVLRRPALNDLTFKTGRLKVSQLRSGRPSYINAILIQTRGVVGVECRFPDQCPGNFLECVRLPGFWGGACGNCKWRDHGARCPLYDENELRLPVPVVVGVENQVEGVARIVEVEDDEE